MDANGSNPEQEDPGSQHVEGDALNLTYVVKGLADGEAPIPFAVTASMGLTPKDAKGHFFGTLTISDGTVTATIRIPWQNAAALSVGIGQGLAAIQAKGEEQAHGGLVLPDGAQPGRLVIPAGVKR